MTLYGRLIVCSQNVSVEYTIKLPYKVILIISLFLFTS